MKKREETNYIMRQRPYTRSSMKKRGRSQEAEGRGKKLKDDREKDEKCVK